MVSGDCMRFYFMFLMVMLPCLTGCSVATAIVDTSVFVVSTAVGVTVDVVDAITPDITD